MTSFYKHSLIPLQKESAIAYYYVKWEVNLKTVRVISAKVKVQISSSVDIGDLIVCCNISPPSIFNLWYQSELSFDGGQDKGTWQPFRLVRERRDSRGGTDSAWARGLKLKKLNLTK